MESRSCIATPVALVIFVGAGATSRKLLVTILASSPNQLPLRQI